MATIESNEDFLNAVNYLIAQEQLTVQGERFIDRVARKVIDERIGGNVDITPDTPTLEAALDGALVDMAAQETVASVQANAKTQAAAIPNWAGWSESQVLAWFDANITAGLPAANLAAANVVLSNMATAQRAMARMIVALRNNAWADMQD